MSPLSTHLDILAERLSEITKRLSQMKGYLFEELVGEILQAAPQVVIGQGRVGRKVEIRDSAIWLDADYVQRTYDPTSEASFAACVLYFLHELIHLPQGLGDKKTIKDLRATGAEQTLMHCDLAADHAAACLAATAVPTWSLVFLKDLGSRELFTFPIMDKHTPSARVRKFHRLISIRMEVYLRNNNVNLGSPYGYLWVEFSSGSEFMVFQNVPVPRLLFSTPLEENEYEILEQAVLPSSKKDVSLIDEILGQIYKRTSRDNQIC